MAGFNRGLSVRWLRGTNNVEFRNRIVMSMKKYALLKKKLQIR